MLETMEERVKLLKAGFDGKSIEELYLKYNNIKILRGLQHKINCWEFNQCGREPGGNKVDELGICHVAIDPYADGLNEGINGGRICCIIAGTFSGRKFDGLFAKTLPSCMTCTFFKIVIAEEQGVSI